MNSKFEFLAAYKTKLLLTKELGDNYLHSGLQDIPQHAHGLRGIYRPLPLAMV